jgi:flagellar basal-body rod modification protein FlgD
MDAIQNVPSVGSSGGTSSSGAIDSAQTVDKDQFLKLLVSQLKNQNPLDPVSNENFISQLAQFSAMEQQTQTNANLDTLIQLEAASATISHLTQASSLLGKKIEYTDPNTGAPGTGIVGSVGLTNGAVVANVNGTAVPILLITGVQDNVPSNN